MDPVQVVAVTVDFVAFVFLMAVAHHRLAPTPVPVPVKTEPSADDIRNRIYV